MRWILALAVTLSVAACATPVTTWPLVGYSGTHHLAELPHLTGKVVSSHDGRRIAYGEPAGLFVMDLDAMTNRKVADSAGPIHELAWLGHTDRVVFRPTAALPMLKPGQPKPTAPPPSAFTLSPLSTVSISTGEVKAIAATTAGASVLKPSPDGRFLGVAKYDQGSEGLYVYDIAADTETLVKAGRPSNQWAWSPDGERIAYLEHYEQGSRLLGLGVVAVGDRTVTAIQDAGIHFNRMGVEMSCYPEEEKFYWAPDGQSLTIVQNQTQRSFLMKTYRVDGTLAGERSVDVGDPWDGRRYVDCYHPSPDGRFVLALKVSGKGGIPEPSTSLISTATESGKWIDVAPPSMFVTWLGNTGRFVYSNNQGAGGYNRYYIGDAAQGR